MYTVDECLQLFQVGNMPFLISQIWMDNYYRINVTLTYRDDTWTSYLPKEMYEQTIQKGLELFSNKEKFQKYVSDFEEYKKHSKQQFESLTRQDQVLPDQVKKLLCICTEFFSFYQYYEFFFTDAAYKHSKQDEVTKTIVDTIGEHKDRGREFLNTLFFGSSALLTTLLNKVAEQTGVDIDILKMLSKQEILEVMHKQPVPKHNISQRNNAYCMVSVPEITMYQGKKAHEQINLFLSQSTKDKGTVHGICAYPGTLTANATIIRADYDTFDKVPEFIDKMPKGNILIAESTSPEIVRACHKAGAIITNQGGMLSHAAIISRELKIPCLIGTGNATEIFKNEDMIKLDAQQGVAQKVKQ